jgi:hypothetical protein
MFGFFSFLPMSTLETVYYNGVDYGFILYIQQQNTSILSVNNTITLDMNLQKEETIVL